ncbi:hypothetical protein [Streptomyces sp. MK37H]|uniref:hypothetical protein n=1 Tax=Streptomyces sp. MK37H TaxID=2699117 RepID=UPI001B373054|nr:hypothetical protein [Streptomyces sp. MK37H]MBP8536106.1 hypothetical protein [Streptomyces sp. MK37H]
MAWSRIDDSLHSHPKIMQVGNAATGLYVRLISYAGQHLTDGFVPASVARSYGTPRLLAALCDANLLAKVDPKSNQTSETRPPLQGPGYVIHDYLDYNPSREQVLAERAKNAARQEAFRQRRRGKPIPPDGAGMPSDNGSSNGVTNGATNGAPSRPDPTRPASGGTERENSDRSDGRTHEPALSLIPPDWQPQQDDIAAAQSARLTNGQPALTGGQLAEVTRKFVRRQTGDRRAAADWGARWQEWAERERPAPEVQQGTFLVPLDGGATGLPVDPKTARRQAARDDLGQIAAELRAMNGGTTA